MEKQIEEAIRQHLIITNEAGVKYAVKRISELFKQELNSYPVCSPDMMQKGF